jgi:hypothetical protein
MAITRSFQAMAQESFVEASRLCFGRQARRDAFVGLVGHMAALADLYRVEWLVACPRVEHAEAYQRMFGFRPLAAPRQYFGVRPARGRMRWRVWRGRWVRRGSLTVALSVDPYIWSVR